MHDVNLEDFLRIYGKEFNNNAPVPDPASIAYAFIFHEMRTRAFVRLFVCAANCAAMDVARTRKSVRERDEKNVAVAGATGTRTT